MTTSTNYRGVRLLLCFRIFLTYENHFKGSRDPGVNLGPENLRSLVREVSGDGGTPFVKDLDRKHRMKRVKTLERCYGHYTLIVKKFLIDF